MSMRKYFRSPVYWIKLAVMSAAMVLIKKYSPHEYVYYAEAVALILIWGFSPERHLIRLVGRMIRF